MDPNSCFSDLSHSIEFYRIGLHKENLERLSLKICFQFSQNFVCEDSLKNVAWNEKNFFFILLIFFCLYYGWLILLKRTKMLPISCGLFLENLAKSYAALPTPIP